MKKLLAISLFTLATTANAELAKVTRVEPIIQNTPVTVPTNSCSQVPVYVNQQSSGGVIGAVNDSIFGSTGGLVGSAVGYAVGSQVHGSGRDIARILGVVVGAKAGDEYSRSNNPRTVAYQTTHCGTSYSNQLVQTVVGYNVTYIFDGRVQQTTLPYNPGEYVNVERSVTVR